MSLDTSGFVQTVNATLVSGTTAPTSSSAPILTTPSPGGLDDLSFAQVKVHPIFSDLTGLGAAPQARMLAEGATVSGLPPFGFLNTWELESTSVQDRPGGTGATEFEVDIINATGAAETLTIAGCPNGAGPYTSAPFQAYAVHEVRTTATGVGLAQAGTVNLQTNFGTVLMGMDAPYVGRSTKVTSGAQFLVPSGKKMRVLSLEVGFDSGPNPIADVDIVGFTRQIFDGTTPIATVPNDPRQSRKSFWNVCTMGTAYEVFSPQWPVFEAGTLVEFLVAEKTQDTVAEVRGAMTFVLYDA